ncbi:MAG: hypothetical protein RQ743_08360 [Bacteroidales bacterium]|nr:hypothetical protein [Bacteroidales bacterium]
MRKALAFCTVVLLTFLNTLTAQSLFDNITGSPGKNYKLGGFIRSGLYFNMPDDSPGIPVSFADFNLNAEAGNGTTYKAFADFRYRYASEYGSIINKPVLREAWAAWYTPHTELKAGKQIIKWSRMDFFRLQDIINPRNDLYRSFDPSDRDLGNISVNFSANPTEKISLQAVLIPHFKPSVLYTGFMDLPELIQIMPHSIEGNNPVSYGLRAEFFLRNFNAEISFFDGYNPLPGLGLDSLNIQGNTDDPLVRLEEKSFKTRTLSAGLEFMPGNNILRAEAIWSDPDEDYRQKEYVMLPEIRWALGFEHFFGDLQLLLEYSGKYLIDFEEAAFDPVLPDESSFLELGSLPPDQVFEYTRLQIASFNRLYNYQLNEYSHYAALRFAYEKELATFSPSLNLLYNITSQEYMVNPVVKIKPADNLEIMLGAEFYKGSANSLFDMINNKLNSIYTGLRIDY